MNMSRAILPVFAAVAVFTIGAPAAGAAPGDDAQTFTCRHVADSGAELHGFGCRGKGDVEPGDIGPLNIVNSDPQPTAAKQYHCAHGLIEPHDEPGLVNVTAHACMPTPG